MYHNKQQQVQNGNIPETSNRLFLLLLLLCILIKNPNYCSCRVAVIGECLYWLALNIRAQYALIRPLVFYKIKPDLCMSYCHLFHRNFRMVIPSIWITEHDHVRTRLSGNALPRSQEPESSNTHTNILLLICHNATDMFCRIRKNIFVCQWEWNMNDILRKRKFLEENALDMSMQTRFPIVMPLHYSLILHFNWLLTEIKWIFITCMKHKAWPL